MDELIPINGVRKIVANRLSEAKRTIPHYYLRRSIQIDKLTELRKELNELMSEGYLTQLHHSSGRVPTEKGYRYYVDHCVDASKTSQVIVPAVVENLIQLHTDTKSLLVDVSQVLSTVCQTACVVVDTQINRRLKE